METIMKTIYCPDCNAPRTIPATLFMHVYCTTCGTIYKHTKPATTTRKGY